MARFETIVAKDLYCIESPARHKLPYNQKYLYIYNIFIYIYIYI